MLPNGVQTRLISEGRREELNCFLSHPGGPLLYFAREEKAAKEEAARRKTVTTAVQLVPVPS